MELNVVPTGPTEMSIYTTPFRRFTLRTDGFASVHAGADPLAPNGIVDACCLEWDVTV
jgi:hypothetical protein